MSKLDDAIQIYTDELMPYKWVYTYENGVHYELTFLKRDLPHLLGLHKLNKYVLLKKRGYKGIHKICLRDLKNKTLQISNIASDRQSKKILERVNNFDKLPVLLGDSSTVHIDFDKSIVNGHCDIDADYLLYNPIHHTHYYFGNIETRKTKGSIPTKQSPMTFFVERDRPTQYVDNQKTIQLIKFQKISLQKTTINKAN